MLTILQGLNAAAQGGKLTANIDKGLPAGAYRLCTINSSSNHQPVIAPVAQHGSLDDVFSSQLAVVMQGRTQAGRTQAQAKVRMVVPTTGSTKAETKERTVAQITAATRGEDRTAHAVLPLARLAAFRLLEIRCASSPYSVAHRTL